LAGIGTRVGFKHVEGDEGGFFREKAGGTYRDVITVTPAKAGGESGV
jgi:hypothetical protein